MCSNEGAWYNNNGEKEGHGLLMQFMICSEDRVGFHIKPQNLSHISSSWKRSFSPGSIVLEKGNKVSVHHKAMCHE